MIYYRIFKYKVTAFNLIKISSYTGEVFVTLEDAQDEFNNVKQGCRQEKNLDKSKKFLVEIRRYDDDFEDYDERVKKEVI